MPATATRIPEQLSLFSDFIPSSDIPSAKPASIHIIKAPAVKEPEPTPPAGLNGIREGRCSLEQLLKCADTNIISFQASTGYVSGNLITFRKCGDNAKIFFKHTSYDNYESNLIFIDTLGRVWTNEFKITIKPLSYDRSYVIEYANCISCSTTQWTLLKKPKLIPTTSFIQDKSTLLGELEKRNPFAAKWIKESNVDLKTYLLAPQIEMLYKAGYSFVEKILNFKVCYFSDREYECFNRICQPGNNPKEIFKTEKPVYTTLKKEGSLTVWDCFRKLYKTGKINADTIKQLYEQNFREKELEKLNSILAKKYEEKPVFTLDSLIHYLQRLDNFEAIDRYEAFGLLDDYLSMCSQLGMKPRIDGDSLKREHDIAARNLRNRRDEITAEKMKDNCEKMKMYDYSENVYTIRGIRDYDDLLDEANQQHNCVASYGQNIARGTSYIYVMRETAHPERSLITIELSSDGKTIRQKYLAYNQHIHNKSQSDFIDRWLKHIKTIS